MTAKTECAICASSVCRLGRPNEAPEDCPMRHGFPDFRVLYAAEEVKRRALEAALVEAYGYRRWTRLDEVGEFARRMECSRVGIAYCQGMEREAGLAASYLRNLGMDVTMPDLDTCNPQGQAELFNTQGTDLNVMVGMCVGHDAIFLKASKVGATCLVARDNFLQHNPVGAIYASRSYFHDKLYQGHPRLPKGTWSGASIERLDEVAWEVAHYGVGRWTRVEEVMEFAHRLGVTRLGLAFCHGLREEARVVHTLLAANGFDVRSVGCKAGAVPKEELGIADRDKVRPGQPEMICNPQAQATLLNQQETQLNLTMGQCVGHDLATMVSLEAPTICLVAKDRVLAHNTVAALYAWEGLASPKATRTPSQ